MSSHTICSWSKKWLTKVVIKSLKCNAVSVKISCLFDGSDTVSIFGRKCGSFGRRVTILAIPFFPSHHTIDERCNHQFCEQALIMNHERSVNTYRSVFPTYTTCVILNFIAFVLKHNMLFENTLFKNAFSENQPSTSSVYFQLVKNTNSVCYQIFAAVLYIQPI